MPASPVTRRSRPFPGAGVGERGPKLVELAAPADETAGRLALGLAGALARDQHRSRDTTKRR